jgi:predicted nucleic acid-binding protein
VIPARAVLDACVLAPHPLHDTLLRLAEADLYRPLWSKEILIETERTVVTKLGEPPEKARKRITVMERSFPDAMTVGFEALIPEMTNDPKDCHVLAAAVAAGADVIVTANLADFPEAALAPLGSRPFTPTPSCSDCSLSIQTRLSPACVNSGPTTPTPHSRLRSSTPHSPRQCRTSPQSAPPATLRHSP